MDDNVQVSAVFPGPPQLAVPLSPSWHKEALRLVLLPLVKMKIVKINDEIVASVSVTK